MFRNEGGFVRALLLRMFIGVDKSPGIQHIIDEEYKILKQLAGRKFVKPVTRWSRKEKSTVLNSGSLKRNTLQAMTILLPCYTMASRYVEIL